MWRWDTSSWGFSHPDFDTDSEFAKCFDSRIRMTVMNVEIRAKNRWKSYVFSTSNSLPGKFLPKKCQCSSTEETFGYRTVPTVLCPNLEGLASKKTNNKSSQIRFFRGLLDPSLVFREKQLNSNEVWLIDRLQTEIGCIFNEFVISSLLVMISDMLPRRKMISVKISRRKKFIETDSKTLM